MQGKGISYRDESWERLIQCGKEPLFGGVRRGPSNLVTKARSSEGLRTVRTDIGQRKFMKETAMEHSGMASLVDPLQFPPKILLLWIVFLQYFIWKLTFL